MFRSRQLLRARSVLLLLLALGLLPVLGCYGDSVAVTGQVLFHPVGAPNIPVTAGTIYFTRLDLGTGANGYVFSAPINADGTYSISVSAEYTYKVSLTNPLAPQQGLIPDRYASPDTSGLSVTLGGAYATYDIALYR